MLPYFWVLTLRHLDGSESFHSDYHATDFVLAVETGAKALSQTVVGYTVKKSIY